LSSLLSFGAGDQFALFESIIALAILLRRFEFKMAPNAPPVAMTTVSGLPDVLSCFQGAAQVLPQTY